MIAIELPRRGISIVVADGAKLRGVTGPRATIGCDAGAAAPGGEILRIQHDPFEDDAASALRLLDGLGRALPCAMALLQPDRIKRPPRRPVAGEEPRQISDAGGHRRTVGACGRKTKGNA